MKHEKTPPSILGAELVRRMKLFSTKTRSGTVRYAGPLALGALVSACLVLGVRTLSAWGDDPPLFMSGGGDAIGSLPFTAPPNPPEALTGEKPSIVFEAPTLEAIQALVVDAYGDGYAQGFDRGEEGGVRVELQGRVTVVLDRNRLETLGVVASLDVSQGFAGGLGIFLQDQRPVRTQILPTDGDLELPLASLSATGALDQGSLTLHSVSVTQNHHRLELSCSGGTLRLVARD